MSTCIPGASDVRQVDASHFTGRIDVAVGPMSGDFQFTARLSRIENHTEFAVLIEGVDSVTKSKVEMTIEAVLSSSVAPQTSMAYTLTATIGGRMAILGEMVFRAAASAMVQRVAACMQARIEGATASEATS
jgi:carbon monoxide dehydrogenase subunit G